MPRRIREGLESLLLDTHVWVWYVEGLGAKISRDTLGLLREHDRAGRLHVSPLSVWEVARLVARGRLTLSIDLRSWITQATDDASVRTAQLTPAVAVDAALLAGDAPRDPVDRLLIATARALGTTLVTRDAEILAYGRAGYVRVLDAAA